MSKLYDPEVLPVDEARGILAMVQLNRVWPKDEIKIERSLGRLSVKFHWQSRNNLWGRFGGGWQWELGFQAGVGFRTVIVNLLICSLRFHLAKKEEG